jgi:NAD-dependent SIR2 family protein deacetylase
LQALVAQEIIIKRMKAWRCIACEWIGIAQEIDKSTGSPRCPDCGKSGGLTMLSHSLTPVEMMERKK